MSGPTMQTLEASECVELMKSVPVGRIAITIKALPVILPVNFVVIDDVIVFRTVPGTKLAAATSGAVVAFEVDSYEPHGRTGWSVVVQGMASEVTDPLELESVRRSGVASWANRETRLITWSKSTCELSADAGSPRSCPARRWFARHTPCAENEGFSDPLVVRQL